MADSRPPLDEPKRARSAVVASEARVDPGRSPRVARFSFDGDEYCVVSIGVGQPPATRLTDAECRVAALIAEGLTNAQIARARGTSTRTVANQVASILAKLRLSSRVGIARYASAWSAPTIDPASDDEAPDD